MCMLSMNKYRLWAIVACALSLTALSSCKSDLLDLKPIDHYGTNNYWNNHAQVEANYQALNGILRNNYSVFRAFGELRAGTMKFTVSATGESQSSVEGMLTVQGSSTGAASTVTCCTSTSSSRR